MPTKEQVRKWQQERIKAHKPPPSPKEIRRQLGRELVEMERERREGKFR